MIKGYINEADSIKIVQSLLYALNYLKNSEIIYRGISAENVFMIKSV